MYSHTVAKTQFSRTDGLLDFLSHGALNAHLWHAELRYKIIIIIVQSKSEQLVKQLEPGKKIMAQDPLRFTYPQLHNHAFESHLKPGVFPEPSLHCSSCITKLQGSLSLQMCRKIPLIGCMQISKCSLALLLNFNITCVSGYIHVHLIKWFNIIICLDILRVV